MSVERHPVVVNARPTPVSLPPGHTAVIVVDMQNDFASRGGMFDRAGIDIATIEAIVEPTKRVLAAARAAGMNVVYLKMGFRPDLSDAGFPDAPTWLKHLPLDAGGEVTAPDGSTSGDARISIPIRRRGIRGIRPRETRGGPWTSPFVVENRRAHVREVETTDGRTVIQVGEGQTTSRSRTTVPRRSRP